MTTRGRSLAKERRVLNEINTNYLVNKNNKKKLGNTDILLSPFSIGTSTFGNM